MAECLIQNIFMKETLKKILSPETRFKIRRKQTDFKALFAGKNLDKLGLLYKTDKIGSHFYTQHYSTHFAPMRRKPIKLLEIGVGGYDSPDWGGESLRMWKNYFRKGRIYSIDIYDKTKLEENRIRIFQGSQVDLNFLDQIFKEIGEPEIIIDDGSHINEHVIETFKFLFPKLKDGGIYVIEDTQTSYWNEYGGSMDFNDTSNMMNFFKSLVDSLNNKEFIQEGYVQTYYDQKIISMHFYHNLIFIYKGNNNEESNLIIGNKLPLKK